MQLVPAYIRGRPFLSSFTISTTYLLFSTPKLKMQKAVLKVDVHCDKGKQKAMSKVGGLSGVNSVGMKDDKLTVTGEIDLYIIMKKLKKICYTEIVEFGPVKEEKKPEPPKPEQVVCIPPYCYYPPPPPCGYDQNPNGCIIS